jgi:hypothetical protein
MGLLDEAIREHLELKRKRGGDPTELAREEHEALGPAVREAGEAAPAPAAADGAPAQPPVAEPPPEPTPAAPEPDVLQPDPEAPPAHHPAPDDALQPDPEAPAAPAEPAPPPEPAPSTSQETVVFDVDDVFAEEDAAEDKKPEEGEEDVLEETPDFLQETPEHDRLWFEQKPPKDFDFDG